jgi:hypothetical protein
MTTHPHLAEDASFFAGHIFAIVAGLVLMIVGLALGVTMVLLPVGLVVGLCGVGVLVWGLFGRTDNDHAWWRIR